MEPQNTNCIANEDELIEAGFFRIKDALEMLTHNKEKSLVDISYKKYKNLKKNDIYVEKYTNLESK
jgi:hypothetical protein